MSFSFFPRTIYQTTSKISGEIVVKKQFGQIKLYVQGTLQSGGIVKGIWERPLKKVEKVVEVEKVEKVLILGLGGGTVVGLIKKYWPEAKITGIEVDPEIIKISKRFFGLDRFKDLKIINADAIERVESCFHVLIHGNKKGKKKFEKFGLVVVDLYLGKEYPKKAESKKFLGNVKRLLSTNGIAIFNRLRTPEANLVGFEEKLKSQFASREKVNTHTNLFFICY